MIKRILLSKRGMVEAELIRLSSRAKKKNLPIPTWTWGKVSSELETHHFPHPEYPDLVVEREVMVSRIEIDLNAPPARYNGWQFVAALDRVEGMTILRTAPNEVVPAMYREIAAVCDHCKTNRYRVSTYVLKHEDGRYIQVGSSCIDDFLGGYDAATLVGKAELLFLLGRALDDGSSSEGSGSSSSYDLLLVLATAIQVIEEHGWISKAKQQEVGGASTSDLVLEVLEKSKGQSVPTASYWAGAEVIVSWATTLEGKSDYEHNLYIVSKLGYVERRFFGIACSMVKAWERAITPKVDKNIVHTGVVGKRETFSVKLEGVAGYETQYGFTTVLRFRDEVSGALIVWKASNTELGKSDIGKSYTLVGTVKEHGEYKGSKQTMVSRCKVKEV